MKKINFLFAVHNHQPVGNFEHIFEKAFFTSYKPFFSLLEKHPAIKTTLHFSGPLLEWIEARHPCFFDKIQLLVERKQVEMMSGGFYEPIFPILREPDALGQMRMMNDFIRARFNTVPRGAWIAERIWDPALTRLISAAGLSYTLLDSTHFLHTGLSQEQIHGYYVTEREGKTLAIFPIDMQLRYTIPFQPPEKTIDYLKYMASEDENIAITYGDDGEKFGMWPGTYSWVYEKGWLEAFFNELEKNQNMIRMFTLSEYLDAFAPEGPVYLPTLSYEEMMEWALPADAMIRYENMMDHLQNIGFKEKYRPFIGGGYWNNFLAKYPESNREHKKMLLVSERLDAWQHTLPAAGGQDSAELARRELYKGQCNCAYWHGLFGGIYLNFLRHAVYEHLISAEKIIDASCHGNEPWIDYRLADFKRDLSRDILISGKNLNAYFSPGDGGGLFELDFKPCSFNLSNIFTRKMEGYHRKLKTANGITGSNHESEQPVSIHSVSKVKEEGLQSYLIYDWYQRFSFIDHFLGESTTLEAFSTSRYTETGDFINAPYVLQKIEKDSAVPAVSFSLRRNGFVLEERTQFSVAVEKSFSINDALMEIDAAYVVKNTSNKDLTVWFGVEFNITLLAGDDPRRYYVFPGDPRLKLLMNAKASIPRVAAFDIKDAWSGFGLRLSMTPEAEVWTFPIETVSQSEEGLEKTYQGSTVLVHWKMPLTREDEQRRAIKITLHTFPGEKERKA